MRVGIIVPQGWTGEYVGFDPKDAWRRTIEVAKQAEQLGFESVWLFDHFHTVPEPTDEITFESTVSLSAIASVTSRVGIGQLVLCAGFRNAALTAKMISTLDVVSGGRAELGIGAGWKQDEWQAYGFRFPSKRDRLATLEDHLEIVTRMLAPGRATYAGRHAWVEGAINEPRGLRQPRIPIVVGGNGPDVTWRLAARYADELNLNQLTPDETAAALPVVRQRCEEIDRDPATLAVSMHYSRRHAATPGESRVDALAGYAELGLSRVHVLIRASATDDDALPRFADDCRRAGVELATGH